MDADRLIKATATKSSSQKMNQCLSGDDNKENPGTSERPDQEENHAHGLVRLSIQMTDMRPFEEQIAGHGIVDGKILLKHPDGRVLKPVQPPPKGVRELGFYRELADSRDDGDSALKGVIPAFYGTAVNEKGDEFLVLKDMTQGMARPTVIDVKIGRQTWLPDASEKKMQKERSKYLGTRPNLGFSVSGMIIHPLKSDNSKNVIANNNGFAHDDPEASEKLDVIRLDKQFGMSLKTEDVHQIPKLFFDVERSGPANQALLKVVTDKMKHVLAVVSEQRKYNFLATSLLMAYDAEVVKRVHQLHPSSDNASSHKEADASKLPNGANDVLQKEQLEHCVNVSIIDFANVIQSQDKDENFINGLKNLIHIFETFDD